MILSSNMLNNLIVYKMETNDKDGNKHVRDSTDTIYHLVQYLKYHCNSYISIHSYTYTYYTCFILDEQHRWC